MKFNPAFPRTVYSFLAADSSSVVDIPADDGVWMFPY